MPVVETIPLHYVEGEGVTPVDRIKVGMVAEVRGEVNPTEYWPVTVEANNGGLLTVFYVGSLGLRETMFYTNERLAPMKTALESEGVIYEPPQKYSRDARLRKASKQFVYRAPDW